MKKTKTYVDRERSNKYIFKVRQWLIIFIFGYTLCLGFFFLNKLVWNLNPKALFHFSVRRLFLTMSLCKLPSFILSAISGYGGSHCRDSVLDKLIYSVFSVTLVDFHFVGYYLILVSDSVESYDQARVSFSSLVWRKSLDFFAFWHLFLADIIYHVTNK